MNKMQGRKDGEKDRQNSRWGEEGASPTRRRLPCLEVHHVTAIKSGWMGRKCGMCAAETLVRASACEHFVWHRQHGGKALRSVCINRYSAHTDQWLDRRQGASAPECQNPAVCSRPPFFLCLSFLSPPSPDSLLFSRLPHHVFFSSLPSVTPHLFSPPTPTAAASRCGQLFNMSPPSGKSGVSFLFPWRDFRGLNLFQVCFFFNWFIQQRSA